MNEALIFAAAGIGGYLIGNIEFAVIISRLTYKDDIRNHGSGNAGTTNMMRVYGMKPGLVTFLFDFLKGVLGTLLCSMLGGLLPGDALYIGATAKELCTYIGAVCIVLGHDYPVFFKLKGGKGAASSLGIAYVLSPLAGVVVTVVCFIVIYASQMVSLGSLLGMTIFTVWMTVVGITSGNAALAVMVCAMWVLLVVRHRDNIQRLIRGEESKLFKRPSKKAKTPKDV
ncbi:MAG: glycerol-3-phosphate 1-O-acyltransferase PlsY [Clostridia bacterium]|nr:glycerol-3-phosphate 1-O-acyltransferase PlsY [Clostridia bacterium]